MLRIAIVDDEPSVCEFLCRGVETALSNAEIKADVAVFNSAEAFLSGGTQPFQLVLLDIQMPGMDGMTCAETLRRRDSDVVIIFITSMVQYAVQGYRVEALDYIVKPVTEDQLQLSLGRALRKLQDRQPHTVVFRAGGAITPASVEELNFVEAVNHSAIAHTVRGEIPCGMTLSAVESLLAPHHFFRCHAAFLINLAKVEQVLANDVVVAGVTVPVSKHRRKAMMQAITAWWGKML